MDSLAGLEFVRRAFDCARGWPPRIQIWGSPLTRHFLQSFHAAPPAMPVKFSSYSKCRGQIDVVGATGLEPATPCSQSRCATTAPRPDAF